MQNGTLISKMCDVLLICQAKKELVQVVAESFKDLIHRLAKWGVRRCFAYLICFNKFLSYWNSWCGNTTESFEKVRLLRVIICSGNEWRSQAPEIQLFIVKTLRFQRTTIGSLVLTQNNLKYFNLLQKIDGRRFLCREKSIQTKRNTQKKIPNEFNQT